MPYMKVVIDTMKDQGIRDDYIVLVGGAPLNEAFGKAVGADAYCRDAAIAVETAKALIAAMRRALRVAAIDRMTRERGRTPASSARHRLRRARPRDRGVARGERLAASRRARACPRNCTTGPERIPGAVRDAHPRESRPLRDDLRGLRRLRHRRRAGRGARAKKASSAFPAPIATNSSPAVHAFEAMADDEPGTFYLTDFLLRHFDRLVIRGLGLDRHPELAPQYFGNYRRLVYLAQVDAPERIAAARARQPTGSGSRSRTASPATADWSEASARPSSCECPAWQS